MVNISSGAAQKPVDEWSGYCASKAASNMLAEVAQKEADIQSSEIEIFALSTGVVDFKIQEYTRLTPKKGFSSLSKSQGLKDKNELSTTKKSAEKILFLPENSAGFDRFLKDIEGVNYFSENQKTII